MTLISSHWVWACLTAKRILPINDSPIFAPLHFACPVRAMVGKCVVVLNMSDSARIETAAILRDIGFSVLFSFSKDAKVVVAGSHDANVANVALEYAIPIVSPQWVMRLIRTGTFPPPSEYPLANDGAQTLRQFQQRMRREVEEPMADIILSPIADRKRPQPIIVHGADRRH
jgi:hypothetical protein